MGMRNCARCGKLFNHMVGAPLCHICREQDEEDYKSIKEYLYQYPGATMTEVATTLEISVSKIKRFLKEGRLEIKDAENFFLECERCGTSIKSGKYCDSCSQELTQQMKSVSKDAMHTPMHSSDGFKKPAKMRYLNKDKDK